MRLIRLALPLVAALLLGGCASKDALDYLPESVAYVCLNLDKIRSQAGSARLLEAAKEAEPGMDMSKVSRMYFAASNYTPRAEFYGAVIGVSGTTPSWMNYFKGKGATDHKLDGRKALKMQETIFLPLSDNAFVFSSESGIKKMIETSKKKNPGALTTPLFQKVNAMSHALSVVLDAKPIASTAGPQLGLLTMMNPAAGQALQNAETGTVLFDWDQQPRLEASLTLADQQAATNASAFLNGLMQQAGAAAAQAGAIQTAGAQSMLQQMKTVSADRDVKVTLDIPKADADKALAQMEQTVKSLPKDPAQREEALKAMTTGAMLKQGLAVTPAAGMPMGIPGQGRRGMRGQPGAATPGAAPTYPGVAPGTQPQVAPQTRP